jgi:hypothetical protein
MVGKTQREPRMNNILAAATLSLLALASACGAPAAAPTPGPAPVATGMPFSIEKLTETFEGNANEVLRVSGYTYVAVDTGAGVRWAVSLQKDIDEGAHVRVRAFGKKEAFESKKLGRTFDELWFAIITPVT